MSTSPNRGDEKSAPPDSSTVILLLVTIADTTWRLFVPVIGLMVLGLVADKQLKTTPWIMTVGLVLGVGIAYILVKRQLKAVQK